VEYTTEFRNLMVDLDWDDSALIASYRRGLNWKVKELMSQQETQPRNLEGWITAAIQIDNIRHENEASRPPRPVTTSKKVTVTTPATVTVKKDIKTSPNYVDKQSESKDRKLACVSNAETVVTPSRIAKWDGNQPKPRKKRGRWQRRKQNQRIWIREKNEVDYCCV
jgi:hypothetical protein